MPRERPDYDAFVQHLHLDREADPFDVLARNEGMRATDRIEVFDAPTRTPEGDLTALFVARGVRHVDCAADAIASLSSGEELELVAEPDNSVNPRAMLLNSRTSERVGYAPDYLLDTIHDLIGFDSGSARVTAEHVNEPVSAPHMRLLCRLTAPWPTGYEPLSGPEFQRLA